MVDTMPTRKTAAPEAGRMPSLAGDIRHLIPKLGLRNYWYPAITARKVPKNRPVQVRMLGEDLVFLQAKNGEAVALTDICPHRGARLSEGHVHWKGTVACPYHGWVFDEEGRNVAVLSEGPESRVCGKPGTEAKKYPTRTLKGVVFVWIGDTAPAPIEEDVPEEFFKDNAYILWNDHVVWNTNWLVALENSQDSHVGYLHRDNMQALLGGEVGGAPGPDGYRPIFTGAGLKLDYTQRRGVRRAGVIDVYPNGWRWPKHNYRGVWNWLFAPLLTILRVPSPTPSDPVSWGGGHRLPGMYRFGPQKRPLKSPLDMFKRDDGGLMGMYTRMPVALEPWKTRLWYFHWMEPKNALQKYWWKLTYNTVLRWMGEYNFSAQDGSMMFNQRYDTPEKLSGTDAEVIQWRKLVVTKAYGGRNAPFGYEREKDTGIEERAAAAVLGGKFGRDMNQP
ncbi:MAG: Rieske 2Fe-2S domain-containing protein [SAR202 cluster bacterium]|nr:Rieske 2Fe-2S domain-containing protein [SAR202 cluster bacterium]